MRNVLKADLRRILKKISIYVWLVVTFVILFLFLGLSDYATETLSMETARLQSMAPILVSLPIFLSVYADDMKSGTIQCIIGRGFSRSKVVLAKYLECLILALIYFAIVALAVFIRHIALNVGATSTQIYNLYICILIVYIKTAGFFAFAAFFVFAAWSTAPGVVALLTLTTLAGPMLSLLQTNIHIGVYDLCFEGLLETAYANIQAGNPGLLIIPAIVLYIGAALLFTIIVFRKKEIEF